MKRGYWEMGAQMALQSDVVGQIETLTVTSALASLLCQGCQKVVTYFKQVTGKIHIYLFNDEEFIVLFYFNSSFKNTVCTQKHSPVS